MSVLPKNQSILFLYKLSTETKLFKHLRRRYNKFQLKELSNIRQSRRKLQNLTINNHFLERCIVNKVVPNFIASRIKRSKVKPSPAIERAFMSDEIAKTVSTNHFIKVKYNAQLSSASEWLSDLDKLRFLRHLLSIDRKEKKRKTMHYDSKVAFLKGKRFGKFNQFNSPNVINMSSYTLSESESFVLSHGLKFAIPPRVIKRENVFSEFEVLAGQLNHHTPSTARDFERLRAKLCDVSYSYCGTPLDLSDFRMYKECFHEYKSLQNNAAITICRPDKASGIVIMNRVDYVSKMKSILDDNSKFNKIGPACRFDYTARIEGSFCRRFLSWSKSGYICDFVHDAIRPVGSQRPKLYGLPKTHKSGCPLRPILSMTNAPQQKLAKFLVKVLDPVLQKFSTYVTPDTFHFVKSLKNLSVPVDNVFMCSFDVKSLFTNVPLTEVIDICKDQLYHSDIEPPDIPEHVFNEMLIMATTNVQFSFDGNMYRQIDGVAMGSALGPILANIFVGFYEQKLFASDSSQPIMYTRYVDDIFAIFHNRDEADGFLAALEKLHPSLAFTREDESDRRLSFLDVLIERFDNNFVTSVFRKSTFSGQYVSWNSFSPKRIKRNLISCLVHRAYKICSPTKLDDEIKIIHDMFLDLGYPEFEINNTIKRCLQTSSKPPMYGPKKCPVYLHLPYIGTVSERFEKQIGNIVGKTFHSVRLRVHFQTRRPLNGICKDVTPTQSKNNVIYKFQCHCKCEYVGRSSQRFHLRISQHVPRMIKDWIDNKTLRPTDRYYFTAIGHHLINNPDCAKHYNDNMFRILARGRNNFHLSVLESIFIKTNNPVLCINKQFVYNNLLYNSLSS